MENQASKGLVLSDILFYCRLFGWEGFVSLSSCMLCELDLLVTGSKLATNPYLRNMSGCDWSIFSKDSS